VLVLIGADGHAKEALKVGNFDDDVIPMITQVLEYSRFGISSRSKLHDTLSCAIQFA
jgi:hypothetical protein